MKKWLAVGLGNPEGRFLRTYHNLGFVCADLLAEKLGLEFKKRGNQMLAKGDALILKPLTYMNRSGEAVVAVVRKQRIMPENMIVFVDDLYIDKGNIRIVRGGSHGGHNGIRSIQELLGAGNYIKIKIGIKPAKPVHSQSNYVLERITAEDQETLGKAVTEAVDAAMELIGGVGFELVQGKHNVKNKEKND
jgi:PTH1 family peptidyl-tRNA hydrolase